MWWCRSAGSECWRVYGCWRCWAEAGFARHKGRCAYGMAWFAMLQVIGFWWGKPHPRHQFREAKGLCILVYHSGCCVGGRLAELPCPYAERGFWVVAHVSILFLSPSPLTAAATDCRVADLLYSSGTRGEWNWRWLARHSRRVGRHRRYDDMRDITG